MGRPAPTPAPQDDRAGSRGPAVGGAAAATAPGCEPAGHLLHLGALGAILTLVTAVMFYFGWRRSDVQAREMSIDVSLFGFSSQDYVLRSISALYLPLLVIFGLGLAWVAVPRVVRALPTG